MLNKNEKRIMNVLLNLCKNNNTCLTSHDDIVKRLKSKEYLTRKEVDDILEKLSLEGYIDCTLTDNRGKRGYCVTVLKKGAGFTREEKDKNKILWGRIGITVALAILSFAVTLILKSIF